MRPCVRQSLSSAWTLGLAPLRHLLSNSQQKSLWSSWGEHCNECQRKLQQGFLFQNVTVLGHYETNKMVVLVWSLQWKIPWMTLMVVPFGKGQGLRPRSSGRYGGRGTVLSLCPLPSTDFGFRICLELQLQGNVRLVSQIACKKHAKKGVSLR